MSIRAAGAHAAFVRRHLLAAAALLPRRPEELSLVLVGDRHMADLHEQFMQIPGPTDVLSFELDHNAAGQVQSGEVYVCVPEARRQAARRGHAVELELLLYALHGLLHLCGYDDKTEADYTEMHRKEDEILRKIKLAAVFGSQPRPTRRSAGGAAAGDAGDDVTAGGVTVGQPAKGDAPTGDAATGDTATGDTATGDTAGGDGIAGDAGVVAAAHARGRRITATAAALDGNGGRR